MSTDPPPEDEAEDIVFFIDRALGKRVAEPLRDAGERVELHDDHFDQSAHDTDWIPEVAKHGWVVLTKDKKLRHRRLELMAVHAAGLRVFTLTSGNMTADEMGMRFAAARVGMKRLALSEPAPFIGKVHAGGRATVWIDAAELAASAARARDG